MAGEIFTFHYWAVGCWKCIRNFQGSERVRMLLHNRRYFINLAMDCLLSVAVVYCLLESTDNI